MKTIWKFILYVIICVVWLLLIWYWVEIFKKAKRSKKNEEVNDAGIRLYSEQKDEQKE